MKLHVIDTGFFKLDGGAMFGVVPKVLWQRINPPDEKNLCTWAMRCLLIDNGNRRILIDTGIGDKQSEKFFSHYEPHGDASLLGSLKAKGYTPEDITDVLLTHLHFDHCGGAVQKKEDGTLSITFPNATYWSHSAHWESAINPNAREKASFLKENILPIQESGQLRFLEDGDTLIEHVTVEAVSGHTEQMLLPHLTINGQKIIYMADLIPSAGHISLPYVMAYDVQPLLTLKEKAQYLQKAHQQNALLFFEHDPKIECCSLKETPKGYRMDKAYQLSEIIKG